MINLAVEISEDMTQDNASVLIDKEEAFIFPRIAHKAEVYRIDDYKEPYWSDKFEVIKYIDDLSNKSKEILGENSVSRFYEFLSYDRGWDFGKGEALSKHSIAILDIFLNCFQEIKEKEPSIFLTRAGNLQLSWEDKFDNPIEVEFFPNKLEYYIETNSEEGEIYFSELVISDIRKFAEGFSL